MTQLLLVVALMAIIASLGSALYYLMRDDLDQVRVVHALIWRIGLSLGVFALLCIGYYLGWIQPHALTL